MSRDSESADHALTGDAARRDPLAALKDAGSRIEVQKLQLAAADAEIRRLTRRLEGHGQGEAAELAFEQAKLQRLVKLGMTLSSQQELPTLLQAVLDGAREIAGADGGTLYVVAENEQTIDFRIICNESLKLHQGGTAGKAPAFPGVRLYDPDSGLPNHKNVVSHAYHERRAVNIADAYESAEFDFSGTRAFDAKTGYRSQSFLTVPLMPRGGTVIGALQLINARDPDSGETIVFSPDIQRFVEALAAQAAITIENQMLMDAHRTLLEAVIALIAHAIDAKSHHTGNHCARVPELALLLAEAAHQEDSGPLADFRFDSEDDWREFRVAAWLHDCGKLTTPEFVVDKATKLETIYNRLHEVRMRFEVLWRDAEIDYWKARAAGETDLAGLDARLTARQAELQRDFALVAQTNVGAEFTSPAVVAELQRIGAQQWLRHFDNRIGLAHEERARLEEAGPPPSLPCPEPLLSDRPEHIHPRTDCRLYEQDHYGLKVTIPENLYNFGELYNLGIGRGTLCDEERFKINEHIIQTIAMLDSLPFPKNLARVPEYACSHHETMNGTGYPRRLKRDDMSVPARIMAIADIFEALTSADRPYKTAKTLSDSLKIMDDMVSRGHIDPELYALFRDRKVYRRFAERFLRPDQIDCD